MRSSTLFLGLFAIAACGGDDDPVDAEPVPFAASTRPASLLGDLGPAEIDALDAHNGLWGVLGLLTTDANVRDLLAIHGGQDRGEICWTSTLQGVSANVDYSSCSGQSVSGAATATDTPLGPLVFQVSPAFEYAQRAFVGHVGLTPVPGFDFLWTLSAAAANGAPSAEPLTVTAGSGTYEVSLGGHVAMDFQANRLLAWGQAEVTGPSGAATLVFGGADAAAVDGSARPVSAAAIPPWPACRCLVAGALSADTAFTVRELEVDLADALDGQGTDWPVIPVAASLVVPGRIVLEPGQQCGRWRARFTPEPDHTATLPGDALRAGVESACAANAFRSPEACESVRLGAAAVQALELSWDQDALDAMADEAAERQLANSFCRI